MTGLEALPELRRVAPRARIVVLSGFEKEIVSDEVLALGAHAYVEKGADIQALVDAFQHVLAGKSEGGKGISL